MSVSTEAVAMTLIEAADAAVKSARAARDDALLKSSVADFVRASTRTALTPLSELIERRLEKWCTVQSSLDLSDLNIKLRLAFFIMDSVSSMKMKVSRELEEVQRTLTQISGDTNRDELMLRVSSLQSRLHAASIAVSETTGIFESLLAIADEERSAHPGVPAPITRTNTLDWIDEDLKTLQIANLGYELSRERSESAEETLVSAQELVSHTEAKLRDAWDALSQLYRM